jgi:hypothetical protein
VPVFEVLMIFASTVAAEGWERGTLGCSQTQILGSSFDGTASTTHKEFDCFTEILLVLSAF